MRRVGIRTAFPGEQRASNAATTVKSTGTLRRILGRAPRTARCCRYSATSLLVSRCLPRADSRRSPPEPSILRSTQDIAINDPMIAPMPTVAANANPASELITGTTPRNAADHHFRATVSVGANRHRTNAGSAVALGIHRNS
ncbi:hypothetical protein [Saccharopolyspora spinosa]|uniref:hypothetical protein n=2 Tax=Saccharopolyspora spinosa TaxID=60894 RepID=UPI00117B6105